MKCCNGDCRQGRDCPIQTRVELANRLSKLVYSNPNFLYTVSYLALVVTGASLIL
jgi:hypothetical protein